VFNLISIHSLELISFDKFVVAVLKQWHNKSHDSMKLRVWNA